MGGEKEDVVISAHYKRCCSFVIYGTLQKQLTPDGTLLQYGIREKEVLLWLEVVLPQADLLAEDQWTGLLATSSTTKCSCFLADCSWFSLHCCLFLRLTQDRTGHESWWKFQLCSIQWTCTQQNLKSLITFPLQTKTGYLCHLCT